MMKIGDGGGYFLKYNLESFFVYSLIFSQSIEHINPKNIIELLRMEYSGYDAGSPINSTERHLAKMFVEEMRKHEKYFVTLS